MPTYLVTPASSRVPAARLMAVDLVDLGAQVAAHMARHKHLTRGASYDIEIGADRGAINQAGLPRPLTFDINKES